MGVESRRGFLKWLGLGAATAATAPVKGFGNDVLEQESSRLAEKDREIAKLQKKLLAAHDQGLVSDETVVKHVGPKSADRLKECEDLFFDYEKNEWVKNPPWSYWKQGSGMPCHTGVPFHGCSGIIPGFGENYVPMPQYKHTCQYCDSVYDTDKNNSCPNCGAST